MKKIIGKLSIGALLLSAAACSGDDLPVYEDVSRVYFYWAIPDIASDHKDLTRLSFGYESPMKEDSIITIPVRVTGRLSNEPRPLKAEVIWAESTVEPGDIEFPVSVIPANSRNGMLRVKVKNPPKLVEKTQWAKIRLAPNEYFHVDRNDFPYGDASYAGLEYNIQFDAKGVVPNMWLDGRDLSNFFMAHSRIKELWIYYMTGFTREDFTYDIEAVQAQMASSGRTLQQVVDDLVNEFLPGELAYGILSRMGRWLEEYKNGTTSWPDGGPKEAGAPLLDENGYPVEVRGSAAGTFN